MPGGINVCLVNATWLHNNLVPNCNFCCRWLLNLRLPSCKVTKSEYKMTKWIADTLLMKVHCVENT